MRVMQRTLILAAIAMLANGGRLSAQQVPVQFQGTTSGCFFLTGTCTPGTVVALEGLTYNSGGFNGWSDGKGRLSLDGAGNNLGTFALAAQKPFMFSGAGWNFLLNVIFQLPTLADPNAVYTAAIAGSVEVDPVRGGVHVMFTGVPQVFNFSGPTATGWFSLVVPEFFVPAGAGAVPVTGNIRATVTPEPATMTLFATGLAGLIPVARRRRRNKTKASAL